MPNEMQGAMPNGEKPNGEKPDMPDNMADGEKPDNMPGGMARNYKDCLVINGGYLELYAEDDCLDSNGNLLINGGTIKATNSRGTFAGAFAVIDPDGETTISENATLIFAAGSGDENSLQLDQNAIVVYCEQKQGADEVIKVADEIGNVLYEYSPNGSFGAVLISSPDLALGKTYTVSVGAEEYAVEILTKTTTVGTKTDAGRDFGGGFAGEPGGGFGGNKPDRHNFDGHNADRQNNQDVNSVNNTNKAATNNGVSKDRHNRVDTASK